MIRQIILSGTPPPHTKLRLPRRHGLKKVVAHTFSPFGPVLPGTPGGPYTIKIRSQKRMYQPRWDCQGGTDPGRCWGYWVLTEQPCSLCGCRTLRTPCRNLSGTSPLSFVFLLLSFLGTMFPVAPWLQDLHIPSLDFNFLPGIPWLHSMS
jgi:hypothetical protein